MSLPPISLAFPVTFAVTAAFSVLAVAAGLRRRASLPVMSAALAALGLISLCLAAGGVAWDRPKPGKIAVLVDISPSTRTATYHDTPTLLARIRQLVGDAAPYTLYELTDQTTPTDAEHLRHGKWSAHTRFAPPADADVILLFSDAQFDDLPATAPPTHVVLDPALEQPADAAIERLEIRRGSAGGAGSSLAISVRNSDRPRELAMTSGTSAGAAASGRCARCERPSLARRSLAGERLAEHLCSAAAAARALVGRRRAAAVGPELPLHRRRQISSGTQRLPLRRRDRL